MQQMDLMLLLVFAGNAEAAQRPEAGVDAVDGSRLGGQRFDQFTAAADEWTGFIGERAGDLKRGGLPDCGDGEVVSVELDHFADYRTVFLQQTT